MKFKNNKLFETYVRNIARKLITEMAHTKDRARLKTLDVIKRYFGNGDFLYEPYDDEMANPDHLNILKYIEYSLIHTFFHANNPDSVIRLEPIICDIALKLGFEQQNPRRPELNKLKRIVKLIKANSKDANFRDNVMSKIVDNTTYDDLCNMFGKQIDDEMAADDKGANTFADDAQMNHRYKIEYLPNFNVASSKYLDYTCSSSQMCFLEDYSVWNQYTRNGQYAVYVLLRDDFTKLDPVHGENTPYDDYGMSMIFVVIDDEGNISSSNTRWNHDLGGGTMPGDVDSAFTKTQLSQLLGVNFSSVFKPKSALRESKKMKRKFKLTEGKQFESYVRRLVREIITEDEQPQVKKKKEKPRDKAKRLTYQVIENYFRKMVPLYYPREGKDVTLLVELEQLVKNVFFHSNISDAVIRLEPLVARIAFQLGFQQLKPNTKKLNRLKRIVQFIKKNNGNPDFPIVLNTLKTDNIDDFVKNVRTFNELDSIFGKYIDGEMELDNEGANKYPEDAQMNHRYEVREIPNFEEAHKYEKFTCSTSPICFTEEQSTWDEYTNEGDYAVYVLLRDDWETVEEIHGEDTPYDDYGKSMIFVIIDEEGNISSSNTRWNHNTGGKKIGDVDTSFTKTELSQLLGVNFDSVFKPKVLEDEHELSYEEICLKYAKGLVEKEARKQARKQAEEKAREMEEYKQQHMEEYLEEYGVSAEDFEKEYEKRIQQTIENMTQEMIPDIIRRMKQNGSYDRNVNDNYQFLLRHKKYRSDESILRLKINNFVNEAIRRYTKKADR